MSPGAAEQRRLQVIVVTYYSGDAVETFLASLRQATAAATEVVLADNGAADPAPAEAARRHPGVRHLRMAHNVGYGAAANAAAAGADTDWLLVANPDIQWRPGALDVLLDAADRWPAAGALGPAILTPDGALYPSARDFPSLARGIGHALVGWWWPANPWTRSYRREQGRPVEGPTGWLSGSCLLLRRAAFDAVGGFDARFFMYFEDLELCRRLADAGWERVLVPAAVVQHAGGHSTRLHPLRMLWAHHVSAYRYLATAYPGPAWAPVRAVLGAGLALRFVASLAVRRIRHGAAPTRPGALLDATGEPP